MMTDQQILLRAGTVIDVEQGTAHPNTDVLITGSLIEALGENLQAEGADVIDAKHRIVLPGLIDVHRHTWQTALRSSAIDVNLHTYLERVLGQYGSRFTPEQMSISTLAGALECLDAGVTTVLDYSHALHSPEHTDAALTALEDSGARAVFGYGFPVHGTRRFDDVRRIRAQLSDNTARVSMALAPVGPSFVPLDVVREDWALADELDLRLTFHISNGPAAARPVTVLEEVGLLHERMLFIHGNTLDDDELTRIAASGASAGSTPVAEAQMTGGTPVIGRLRRAGVRTGLGVDAVTSASGDLFTAMRAALLGSQIADPEPLTVADVLRMATIDGAAALGLADQIGSLTPGKQADVVLLSLDEINLLGAEQDPVGAVVTAAHPGNVETVLVAGRVVKSGGRLSHAGAESLPEQLRGVATKLLG